MQDTNIPPKIVLPFANGAGGSYIRTVPVPSQIGTTLGAASFTDGFPPATFVPAGAGGAPPDGRDVNYVLNVATAWARWYGAGGPVYYDAAFSAAIGGYPAGAVIQKASGAGLWRCQVDNNPTNPDTGGANWLSFLAPGAIGGFTSVTGSTTLTLAMLGNEIQISGSAVGQTVTLPPIATMPSVAGNGYWIVNATTNNWTIHANGTENIINLGIGFTLRPGESIFVFNQMNVQWNAFGTIGALNPFAAFLLGGSPGSIPYQTASGLTSMLSPGVAGYALTSGGAGAPVWIPNYAFAPAWFSYYNAAAGGGGSQYVNYQTSQAAGQNALSAYSGGLATFSVAGVYKIEGTLTITEPPNSPGYSTTYLYKNGANTGPANQEVLYNNGPGGNLVVAVAGLIRVNAGDTCGIYNIPVSSGRFIVAGYGSFTGHKIAN